MLGRQGVQWRFIPKRAPRHGGRRERPTGPTKMALKKVLGRSSVTLTVLQTLIVEVEAILNNRPLTYVSCGLNDLEPLTPSQLLHGHRIVSLPHEQVTEQYLDDPTFSDYLEVNQRACLQAALLGYVGDMSISPHSENTIELLGIMFNRSSKVTLYWYMMTAQGSHGN